MKIGPLPSTSTLCHGLPSHAIDGPTSVFVCCLATLTVESAGRNLVQSICTARFRRAIEAQRSRRESQRLPLHLAPKCSPLLELPCARQLRRRSRKSLSAPIQFPWPERREEVQGQDSSKKLRADRKGIHRLKTSKLKQTRLLPQFARRRKMVASYFRKLGCR